MTTDHRRHPLYFPTIVIMVGVIMMTIWAGTGLVASAGRHNDRMDVACHAIEPAHRPQVCEDYTR